MPQHTIFTGKNVSATPRKGKHYPGNRKKVEKVTTASNVSELLSALQSLWADRRTTPRSAVQLAHTALAEHPREMIAAILRQETALLLTMCNSLERAALKKAGGIADAKGKLTVASSELLRVQGKLHQTVVALARLEGVPTAQGQPDDSPPEAEDTEGVAAIIHALDGTA